MDKLLKKKLLSLFKEFTLFCKTNNLTYYAAYGTAIGAVRHHGIIPWDDDIDVWMPRDDYEKLLKLKSTLLNTNYEITNIENKGYYLYFAKFCNRNTSIIEREGEPIIGLYIDIFPLDNYDESRGGHLTKLSDIYRILWLLYGHGYRNYHRYEIQKHLYHKEFTRLLIVLLDTLLKIIRIPLKFIITKINNRLKSVPYTGKVWMYSIIKSECRIYPSSWFGKGIKVPFEDFEVILPTEYDKVQHTIYGDYMTPPIEANRKSHHFRYFIDLNQRLSRSTIIKKLYRTDL